MSTNTKMTMKNPLYEAQRALFQTAVQRAHRERSVFMRRLVEAVFGRRSDDAGPAPEEADIDRASLISMESLRYGRPF